MDVYKIFYQAYYEDMKEHFIKFSRKSVFDPYELNETNYFDVVLQPTSITEADFRVYEKRIGLVFPQSFKKYYSTCYSRDPDLFTPSGILVAAWKEDPFKSLEEFLSGGEIMLKQGLIPVGIFLADYVCLDTNAGDQNDMPVVLFDDDEDENPAKAARPWFSSFEKYIACMTDEIKTGTDDNFNTIDPGNNYSYD